MTTASVSDLPTGTAAPSTTATPPPESSGVASSGLSKGAVAGVAVGSTAAGILLLGGIGWLAWRKRKTPAQTDDAPEQLVDESQVKPPELGGPTVHEAPTPTPSQPRPPTPIYEAP
jgi:LPXTG-motif cell wall-anchored protein